MRPNSPNPVVGFSSPSRLAVEYVLPLKWDADDELADLTGYLYRLAEWMDVTVVDGSRRELFDHHHRLWHPRIRHVAPDRWPGSNGKVAGVVTGVRAARHPRVVIADDDVRWEVDAVRRGAQLLDRADLVRPQNYFSVLPWHARWDTSRTLVNRAFGSDYPGTYVLRRDTFLRMGGYDGDAMFENLEMARTIRAAGGHELRVDDLFVARRPPSAGHFLRQRVRQAYDSLAQPARLLAEVAMLPGLVALGRAARRRCGWQGLAGALSGVAAVAVCAAEVGRRRDGGAVAFSSTASLWTPVWLLERAICVWIALGCRLRGGVRYGDRRVLLAAHRLSTLRRQAAVVTPLERTDGSLGESSDHQPDEPLSERARGDEGGTSFAG
jgi:hypothetical protein